MKTVRVARVRNFDFRNFVKRSAVETDYTTFIREPCILLDDTTDRIVCVYSIIKENTDKLLQAVRRIRYIEDVRTEGLKTRSRIFGFRPRETIRKDFCSATSLSVESPDEHATISDFGNILARYYEKYCGEIYQRHKKISDDEVLPQWKIRGTPFTSGIVNKNNPLKYHFDSGNFENVYSNMLAFKHNVIGGYLSIPEYDIGLEIANKSVVLFDGQKILHGVTPIKYLSDEAYRYTLVYYTLKKMWNCEPLEKELARVRQVKTTREIKRYERMKGLRPSDRL